MSVCNHGIPRACEECELERLKLQVQALEKKIAEMNRPKVSRGRNPYDFYSWTYRPTRKKK